MTHAYSESIKIQLNALTELRLVDIHLSLQLFRQGKDGECCSARLIRDGASLYS